MTGPCVRRYGDLLRASWKNGGGETREIASEGASAAGGADATFAWRVSLATIAGASAFSSFPGVDRTLCLVRGAPLRLTVNDLPCILAATSDSVTFRGEDRVHATAPSETTVDFNVMTERSRFTHAVGAYRVTADDRVLAFDADVVCVLAVASRVRLRCESRDDVLEELDALVLREPGTKRMSASALDAHAAILIAEIRSR